MRALFVVAFVAACKPVPLAPSFTLRIAVSGQLDPVIPKTGTGIWTSITLPIVFQALLEVGEHGEIVPLLAARTEPMGQRGLRIWLRKDARFSDGSAVGLDDVTGSFAAVGLRATRDGDAILVSSDDVSGPAELLASRVYIFRIQDGHVLGSGPFRVDEQDAQHVLLSRVAPAPGLIARVRLDSYPNPQEAFARTLKGDADMLPEVQPRWVELLEGVPRLRVLRSPGVVANMVAFNLKRLSRAERRALSAALSSDEVRQLAFGNDCVPPIQRPEIEPLPAGRKLDLLSVPFLDRFAFAVRRSFGSRGGDVRTAELQEFITLIGRGDFDLATLRPQIWPPIAAAWNWRTGAPANLLGYSNPVFDAALNARNWAAAQHALEDDPPGAVVCIQPSVVVLDSRIKNARLRSSFMASLPQWEVAQ